MLSLIIAIMTTGLVHATILVTSPLVTDFDNNTIAYFYANFGEVPYGKSLAYELIVLDHGLCGNPKNMQKLTKPAYVAITINSSQSCSYAKRAEVAQRIGAKGLIIADKGQVYPEEAGKAIEADDGNGKKIHIVCLFITVQSFQILQQLKMVEIMAKFPVPRAKVSTVTLFVSAAKRDTYVFLRQFREEFSHLKNHTKVQLVYHTMECPNCGSENCYFSSFCSYDYQYYQPNVGQKIVSEQLHQYAVFTQKGEEKWMDYMSAFDEYCDGDWYNLQECTKSVRKRLQMEAVSVTDPIDRTLAGWRVREVHLGFDSFPEVAVNGMIYRGNFQVEDIVLTICSSLEKPPKYCREKQSKEQITPKNTNNSVVMILMAAIGSLMALVGCTICCYRRFIRNELTRDMASKVGEIIASYASKLGRTSKKKGQELVEVAPDQL